MHSESSFALQLPVNVAASAFPGQPDFSLKLFDPGITQIGLFDLPLLLELVPSKPVLFYLQCILNFLPKISVGTSLHLRHLVASIHVRL